MEELSDAVHLIKDFLEQQQRVLVTNSNSATNGNSDRLFKCLQHVAELENQSEIGENVAKKSEWIESLVSFATCVFEALSGSGTVDKQLGYCLQLVFRCLISWTDRSKCFRITMLREGHLFGCMLMLNKLSSAISSEFASYLIVANIAIIYNCAREELFSFYHGKFTWFKLLQPWTKSTNKAIKLHSVFLLGYIAPSLSQLDHAKLCSVWTEADMKYLVDLLLALSSSPNLTVDCDAMLFSAEDIVSNLLNLIHFSKECFAVVCKQSVLQPCLVLLQKGTDVVNQLTCQLLWQLLLCSEDSSFKGLILLESALTQEISSLTCSTNADIALLAQCLEMDSKEVTVNIEQTLKYINACYQYKLYNVCLEKIDGCLASASGEQATALQIMKGKVLFSLYQDEKHNLQKNAATMNSQKFFKAHSACFGDKAKQVVMIFGKLLDQDKLDEAGTKMLDIAMLDIIVETNKLYECKRCYLCHRQLGAGAGKGGYTKDKLISSHLFPKAMLERFSSGVPLPSSKKIYDTYTPGIGPQFVGDQPQTAKESSLYMLCHCCEDLLSQHGENWFLTSFFDKLYDTTVPEKSRGEQTLSYSSKLYLFCIGILFRTLSWDLTTYINSDECYKLLVQCRACLLNHSSLSTILEKPEIYLLMSPLSATKDDLKYGHMNQVLSGTCNSNTACINLQSGITTPKSSLMAYFHVVHMGMLNILVKFSPSAAVTIPKESIVNPEGGQYFVPAEDKRRSVLPKGLWTMFECLAKDYEESWYSHQNKPYLLVDKQEKSFPDTKTADSFNILSGVLQEMSMQQSGPTPFSFDNKPKVVNLLPDLFHVRSPDFSDDVVLPEGHSLLLHQTFQTGSDGVTLFVAIGNSDKFSPDKPYVVWHQFMPGLQTNFAFFFSLDNLKGTEFLSSSKEKFFTVNPDPNLLLAMEVEAPQLLNILFQDKGIYSIKSLLFRLVSARHLPSIDTPCKEGSCWYCSDRCTSCLQPAVSDYTVKSQNNKPLEFCSKDCQMVFIKAEKAEEATKALIINDKGEVYSLGSQNLPSSYTFLPRCFPLTNSHHKVVHIVLQSESKSGFMIQKEIALCISDGTGGVKLESKYVVHWSRTLYSQNLLEYLVDDDLSPTAPVPHLADNPVAARIIEAIKQFKDEQVVLQKAIKTVESSDASK